MIILEVNEGNFEYKITTDRHTNSISIHIIHPDPDPYPRTKSIGVKRKIFLTHTAPHHLKKSVNVFLQLVSVILIRSTVGGTSQSDQEIVNLSSTCHTALDACERDPACRWAGG